MLRVALGGAILYVLCFAIRPTDAQDYQIGDLVVVIADADLTTKTEGKVDEVGPGVVLQVEAVNGKWLWVRNERAGWLDSSKVVSGKLQGTWIAESAKQGGKASNEPVGDKVVVAGLTMSIKPKQKKAPPTMTIHIDAAKSPKHIDLVYTRDDKTLTVRGVYEVADDTLRLCLSPPGTPRPEQLESQADTKQVSLVLIPEAVALAKPRFDSLEPLLGEIRVVAFTFAPRGWAPCEGQLLQIKEHQALFSLLGTTYGGDGRTTFALPDLRGRVPVHAGQAPELAKVTQGLPYGGEKAALADDGKGTATRPYQGLRYVIALEGQFPSRTESNEVGRFIGEIRMFAGTFAPKGWAYCDGQPLAISENKSLFAEIGTTYGGDETEFYLPDLRGRVPIHAGIGPGLARVKQGETGGGEKVAKSTDPDKSVGMRATLGIRYMIALEGVDPARKGVDSFIGEIRILAGKSTPRLWAPCDGQILSIAQNTALFSLVGTMYGGDGRQRLGLPGLRGRAPVDVGKGADLIEVKLGQRGGGSRAATATDAEDAVRTQPYLGVRFIIATLGIYPSRS